MTLAPLQRPSCLAFRPPFLPHSSLQGQNHNNSAEREEQSVLGQTQSPKLTGAQPPNPSFLFRDFLRGPTDAPQRPWHAPCTPLPCSRTSHSPHPNFPCYAAISLPTIVAVPVITLLISHCLVLTALLSGFSSHCSAPWSFLLSSSTNCPH